MSEILKNVVGEAAILAGQLGEGVANKLGQAMDGATAAGNAVRSTVAQGTTALPRALAKVAPHSPITKFVSAVLNAGGGGMPISKHLDPLVGMDIHIHMMPAGPIVVPIPLPTPHVGLIIDPSDYLPIIGSTVKVGGLHRAMGGTAGQTVPAHIPMGAGFLKLPTNDSECLLGSMTVLGDGDVLSYLGLPVLSCSDIGLPSIPRIKKSGKRTTLNLPMTFVLSIPALVNISGAPTISVMSFVMKGVFLGLGKLIKKVKALRQLRKQNRLCANGLDPVDLVTGAVFDSLVDAKVGALCWERHYSTARAHESGPLGYGFRHTYQYELGLYPQGVLLRLPNGNELQLPRITADAQEVQGHGVTIKRVNPRRFEVLEGERTLVFERADAKRSKPLLRAVREGEHSLLLEYDGETLRQLVDGAHTFRLDYDDRGRITTVKQVSAEQETTTLASYGYDSRGNLVESLNAVGGRHRFTYDEAHRWLEKANPRGYRYAWRYDDQGRCIEGRGEDGAWEGRISYYPMARETRVFQRDGEWTYRYDENQTIVQIVDPMSGSRQRELDDNGRVVRDVDSGGRATNWIYDESGRHIASVDRFGYALDLDDPDAPHPLEHAMPDSADAWLLGGIATWSDDHVLTTQSDACGRILSTGKAGSTPVQYEYDSAGNLTSRVDRDGRRYGYAIGGNDLVTAESDPLGHTTLYRYNASEQVTAVIDPGGTESSYVYDAKDRLTHVYRHGALREQYVYDSGDRLVEKRGSQGELLLRLEHGKNNLISARHLSSGESQHFEYDEFGYTTVAKTDRVEVRQDYVDSDRLAFDKQDGRGIEHEFRNAELTRSTLFGRFSTRYEWNKNTRKVQITDSTGGVHHLDASTDFRLRRQHPNGCSEESAFDRDGRCTEQGSIRYSYTAEGDLLEVKDPERGNTCYHWDHAHRLIGQEGPAGAEAIELDSAGNVLRKAGLDHVVLDSGNRLAYANDEVFTYDARDHLAERVDLEGRRICYEYDSLDQLTLIQDVDRGFWIAEYDALGRRISSGFGDRRRSFYWDGERIAAELAPSGRLRIYVYPSATALVPLLFVDYDSEYAAPESGRVYTLFTNNLGMPLRVVDARGECVWWASHVDAYGEITVHENSSIELNLRWPGHYFDPETGLHYNRFRYYDPTLGRYLQSDPAGTEGGVNLYAYVPNPVSNVDLLGLAACGEKANSVWSRLGLSRISEAARRATLRLRMEAALVAAGHYKNIKVSGSARFRLRVMVDLQRLSRTRTGRQILSHIGESGKRVEIRSPKGTGPAGESFGACYVLDPKNARPKTVERADGQFAQVLRDAKGGPIVSPDGTAILDVDASRVDIVGRGSGSSSVVHYDPDLGTATSPSFVNLGHELSHSRNAAFGNLRDTVADMDPAARMNAPNAEEISVVADENAIRAEARTDFPDIAHRENYAKWPG